MMQNNFNQNEQNTYNQNYMNNNNYNTNPNFVDNQQWRYYDPLFAQQRMAHLSEMALQKKKLKTLGNYTGLAFVGYILIQNILSILVVFTGLNVYYNISSTFQIGFEIAIVILSIFVAFTFFGKKMNLVSNVKVPIEYDMPKNKKLFLLSIPAGIGICMVANYITSYMVILVSIFGIELSTPSITSSSTSGIDMFLTYIQVVLVAAFVEELSLRGNLMGNLKQYGLKFAAFTSAVIFGAMHANLVQAPFAFIVGLGLGYLVLKTGSIWTGIAIHALNNCISITVTYLYNVVDENTLNLGYTLFMYAAVIAGAICLTYISKSTKNDEFALLEKKQILSFSQKCRAYFSAPVLICALVYIACQCLSYVSVS